MPERIYKLQPNRTLALRGFDDLGASAALHSATASSFKVSGCFRDPADFAVLILHDADNFYEHPRLKYLPDTDFTGLVLSFDVHYTSTLMQLNSTKYPSIDWPFLDVKRADGSDAKIRLSEHATKVSGEERAAECTFTVQADLVKRYDRLTLWYMNHPFDYIVPQCEVSHLWEAAGVGTVHSIDVDGTNYGYTEQAGDDSYAVAAAIVTALSGCPAASAALDASDKRQVNLRSRRDDNKAFDVVVGSRRDTLTGVGPYSAALHLANEVNITDYDAAGTVIKLRGAAEGATVRMTAQRTGVEGNMLGMYSIWNNGARLRTTTDASQFSGGASDVTWNVRLDFSALGIDQVRLMWLTFAPALANGSAFEDVEWEATFSNWSLTGLEETRALKVAAPGSVRVEETDKWCKFQGDWTSEMGFYSQGWANGTKVVGDSVVVKYACERVHDLYIGTSLYSDRGVVAVSLNGDPETLLDCRLAGDAHVNTRRRVRKSVSPGEHSVTLRLVQPGNFYFDFLEAAVPGDVPDALEPNERVSPALDYSTDHTYKLPPARIMWMFDKLGYAAPMNEYIGVFWWNQRKRVDAVIPEATVTFGGSFANGDVVLLRLGPDDAAPVRKSVYPADTPASIARHFAQLLNAYSVAVWARADGDVLTITPRSPRPSYLLDLAVAVQQAAGSAGTAALAGSLRNGANVGKWQVDPAQDPALNRGAREWHSDMFRECAARNREYVVSASMELVNPPSDFPAVFPNGAPVETSINFGTLTSTHCGFRPAVLAYQRRTFTCIAGLMQAAGLIPNLQFGEYLWWFHTQDGNTKPGMAFYDPDTSVQATSALGRPLASFWQPTDDPGINGGTDSAFLRGKLRDHVSALASHIRSAYPAAKIEVLFPYDVNHPEPAGIHKLGGPLNRFVNFPAEWSSKETCGFDRIKMEALDFGAWSRNLDLAATAIRFPLDLGWPVGFVRHLVPIFRPGYAWEKEVEIALAAGIKVVNLWAYDHVCIYGWSLAPSVKGRSAIHGV